MFRKASLKFIFVFTLFAFASCIKTNLELSSKDDSYRLHEKNVAKSFDLLRKLQFSSASYCSTDHLDDLAITENQDLNLLKKQNLSLTDYKQIGLASWYGPGFVGRKTASGEKYSPNLYTAAHKKLAFGSLLLVENFKTGKQVLVKVNDRGPFVKNRMIDLSYQAAKEIGLLKSGVMQVKITQVLKKPDSIQEKEVQKLSLKP